MMRLGRTPTQTKEFENHRSTGRTPHAASPEAAGGTERLSAGHHFVVVQVSFDGALSPAPLLAVTT